MRSTRLVSTSSTVSTRGTLCVSIYPRPVGTTWGEQPWGVPTWGAHCVAFNSWPRRHNFWHTVRPFSLMRRALKGTRQSVHSSTGLVGTILGTLYARSSIPAAAHIHQYLRQHTSIFILHVDSNRGPCTHASGSQVLVQLTAGTALLVKRCSPQHSVALGSGGG